MLQMVNNLKSSKGFKMLPTKSRLSFHKTARLKLSPLFWLKGSIPSQIYVFAWFSAEFQGVLVQTRSNWGLPVNKNLSCSKPYKKQSLCFIPCRFRNLFFSQYLWNPTSSIFWNLLFQLLPYMPFFCNITFSKASFFVVLLFNSSHPVRQSVFSTT